MKTQFAKDIENGLNNTPKSIPSKYFYDEIGDDLFIKIMNLPEYYLTRCETEIFESKTDEIISQFDLDRTQEIDVIELGAGDGTKTKILLKKLLLQGINFTFHPIDISINALNILENNLKDELPSLNIKLENGDYFIILQKMNKSTKKKVVLLLGSNIGNMTDNEASAFIQLIADNLNKGDILLLGADLIKSSDIIIPAYDDSEGVTKLFNYNLLNRINNELDANFNADNFKHKVTYNESEGIVRTYLQSLCDQEVAINALNKSYYFEAGEFIHTEISRKYNDKIINSIIANSGLRIIKKVTDSKNYFANYFLLKEQ